MKCPTCSQPVPKDTEGLVQARVATRIHAERAARLTAAHVRQLEDRAWEQVLNGVRLPERRIGYRPRVRGWDEELPSTAEG